MARRPGLGRGLDSLIPSGEGRETAAPTSAGTTGLIDIPVNALVPNPNQPRVHFDEESLNDLSASIKEVGVLQPLLVRLLPDQSYQLIAGERRWRAAKQAGLTHVPAVVRETDDLTSVENALVENLHRQDLSPLEEASAYQQLIDEFNMTHDSVAKRVGKSRSAVSNSLRLLGLPASIQGLIADGRLSAGHAKVLLGTDDRAFQESLAKRVVAEGLSVRALEDAVRERSGGAATPSPATPTDGTTTPTRGTTLREPGLLELEMLIAEHLATTVQVRKTGTRGTITIQFADLADLERIYYAMMGASNDSAN